MQPEELILTTELVCGTLHFNQGDGVTALKVNENTYKVFVSNGWWAVDRSYFEPSEVGR